MLSRGGAFVAKVLAGGADAELLALSSSAISDRQARQAAGEPQGLVGWYVVAQGFKRAGLVRLRLAARGRGLAGNRLRLRGGAGGFGPIGRVPDGPGPGAALAVVAPALSDFAAPAAGAAGGGNGGPPPCCLR